MKQRTHQDQSAGARVVLVCGPVGAGKTTYARQLEQELKAVRFSCDEWMLQLFGEHMDRLIFDERLAACNDIILGLTSRLIVLGCPVVLDCGFWRREQRLNFARAATESGGRPELHYLRVPQDERWRRLLIRNEAAGQTSFRINRQMFEEFEPRFEVPEPDEEPVVIG